MLAIPAMINSIKSRFLNLTINSAIFLIANYPLFPKCNIFYSVKSQDEISKSDLHNPLYNSNA